MKLIHMKMTVLALVLMLVAQPFGHTTDPKSATPRTRLVLLGTGTPLSEPGRSGPAVAVVVDNVPYLFDAGAGVVRQLSAARAQGIEALRPSSVKTVFFTHLHSDHTLGYPELILAPWVLGRDANLRVYGPHGISSMTLHILAAYQADIAIREKGLEHEDALTLPPRVHEIAPGLVYQDERVKVFAFKVRHGEMPAFGYRVESPDRTIVISGDTAPSDATVANCNGCDILLHEVYSTTGFAERPKPIQNYHSHYHTSSAKLVEIAARAHPSLLVVYHELLWNEPEAVLKKELSSAYAAPFAIGHDLDVF